jgi:flagellar basal body-associated protein FliL
VSVLSGQAETAGTAQIFGAGKSDEPTALLLLLLVVVVVVVAVVVVVVVVITFMQGIYNYVSEINRVSSACSAAAVLCLQFMLHVMLFHKLEYVT